MIPGGTGRVPRPPPGLPGAPQKIGRSSSESAEGAGSDEPTGGCRLASSPFSRSSVRPRMNGRAPRGESAVVTRPTPATMVNVVESKTWSVRRIVAIASSTAPRLVSNHPAAMDS